MPDLPPVSESFDADGDRFLAALQAMIDQAERLAAAVDADIAKIAELRTALAALPDAKVIEVVTRYVTEGEPPGGVAGVSLGDAGSQIAADAAALRTEAEAARDAAGADDDLAAAIDDLAGLTRAFRDANDDLAASSIGASDATAGQAREADRLAAAMYEARQEIEAIAEAEQYAAEQGQVFAEQVLEENENLHMLDQMARQAAASALEAAIRQQEASDIIVASRQAEVDAALTILQTNRVLATSLDVLAHAQTPASVAAVAANAALYKQAAAAAAAGGSLLGLTGAARAAATAAQNSGNAAAGTTLTMLALGQAVHAAGSSIGAATIPTGLLAFGITSLGIGIHLIVMGVVEFLAVFVPAMFAAAAAASVLVQGIGNVVNNLTGMYDVGESLGPMFGKTQGDMLGLGHSLQIAQNAADPRAYELLGEAILAVRSAVGKTDDSLQSVNHTAGTASQGISNFGQMGLAVSHILNGFFADIDIDMNTMSGTITSLLSNAVQDLVEFGQLFGNLGHAILNFANDMPGAAELALKVLDLLSRGILWLSNLPHGLIEFVMLFEELYRWTGLVAGAFSLVGRGIALIGTLGIPVLAKIGLNIGQMFANLINGVAGMIANFVVMGEKAGIFGAKVDSAAESMVEGLGGAADFMTGPWGAALALGGLAIAGLILYFRKFHSATTNFIDDAQQAVSAASNLKALNVIGNEMAQTTAKLAIATNQLSKAPVPDLFNTKGIAQLGTQATVSKNSIAALGSSVESFFKVLVSGPVAAENAAIQAGEPVRQLSAFQKSLANQSLNVVTGAQYIAKTYGGSFADALGIADDAGVQLTGTLLGQSKAALQARIEIAGLILGYHEMDLSGGTLNNSMEAVNATAQIQASKVGTVNQAWDTYIGMTTSLTGSFSQFNLDLQQMGNTATVSGSKISAFTGDTTKSVQQTAQALASFKGSSNQTWQSFNSSVSQANTFMDSLRTAAAANVVPAGQFQQAMASIVGQLLPFAQYSKTATAELSTLAQESGGPATSNFQTLKSWVDKNAVSGQQFTGIIDTLTQKLSNVTAVAQTFAGTLQTDVINAIASAGVNTSNITSLTQDFTESLESNGTQSGVTTAAQNKLNAELKKLGFTQQDVNQIDAELVQGFGNVSGAATITASKAHGASGAWEEMNAKARTLASNIKDALVPDLESIPRNTYINVVEKGTGTFSISQIMGAIDPSSAANQAKEGVGVRAAGGARIPGYGGGDSVAAMLEPGEAVVPKHLVSQIAPFMAANRVPGFAAGGIVPGFSGAIAGLGPWTDQNFSASVNAFSAAMESAVKKGTTAAVNAAASTGGPATSAAVAQWISTALAATGSPASWLGMMETLVSKESGGNPQAVDPQAVDGEHATGIAQMLPSTFAAYNQIAGGSILNPIVELIAALRYIRTLYGSPAGIPGLLSGHYSGYDQGGMLMPGLTLAYNGTGQPEKVTPPGGGGEASVIHNVVNLDGQTIWENQQAITLRYNLRNGPRATGSWAPG